MKIPEHLIPSFERLYVTFDRECKRGDKYSFHVPNARSIVERDMPLIKKVFRDASYVDYLFVERLKAKDNKFFARLNAEMLYPQYDDSDKFLYVISTAAADSKYAKKYLGCIGANKLTDQQAVILECVKVLSETGLLSPSALWLLISCVWMKPDPDKVSQMFDIDIKRGRKRCLETIKQYFT